MTIALRGDIWWVDFMTPSGRVRKSTQSRDKVQAQRIHDQWLADSLEKRLRVKLADTKLTLGSAFERVWREDAKWRASKGPNTIRIKVANVLAYFGKDRTVASITSADLLALKLHRLDQGMAASTINAELGVMTKVLEYAVKWSEIAICPKIEMVPVKKKSVMG